MNCSICQKEIVLIPSATERAAKFGGKPSDYTALFTEHAECALRKREAGTRELIACSVTVEKGTKSFSQEKHDKYVRQQVKSMTNYRSKGHRDFVSLTDAQIKDAAEALARVYNVGQVFTWAKVF